MRELKKKRYCLQNLHKGSKRVQRKFSNMTETTAEENTFQGEKEVRSLN